MHTPSTPAPALARTLVSWSVLHAITCLSAVILTILYSRPLLLALPIVGSFSFLIFLTRSAWTPVSIFGPANLITLSRLLLAISLLFLPPSPAAGLAIVLISIVVLVLDGFDGWIARKHGLSSEFGEYFDKESDAFFMLVLCVAAFFWGRLDAWILVPGLLRYGFVLALFLLKPDLGKEYRSNWARWIYVCAISGLLSVFVLPPTFHLPVVIIGAIALILSFAHYFRWLLRQRFDLKTKRARWLAGLVSLVILNTLLLLPSLITNLETSSFFPIPDPSTPTSTLMWTRGWYDYFLYFFIRRPNQDIFRLCLDLVFLFVVYAVFRRRRGISVWLSTVWLSLLLYEVYDAVAFSFFHRHGIMYEDARYAVNLYYLFIDSLSPAHAFRLIGLVTGVVILAWSLPPLFRSTYGVLSAPSLRRPLLLLNLLLWPYAIVVWLWFGPADERPTIRTISGKMVSNAVESSRMATILAEIDRLPLDPVYYSYEGLALRDRPNIVFFMVESYGRILHDDPFLRAGYDSLMLALESQFESAGYFTATRTSHAPVSGGLSWLSMNSVFSGLSIANRTFYMRYLSRIEQHPHLVRILKQAGYHTVTLQPPNRARLGLPLDNHYRFDTTIFFDDLNYSGSAYSIWIIPDQYSLEYAQEHFLQQAPKPFFLFFETATTHAPWTDLPPYVDDWRTLNEPAPQKEHSDNSISNRLRASFENRFNKNTPNVSALYRESISYDFKVLRDYILYHAPANTLIFILGDHQPPLLPSSSYETPVHVLSRESALIESFSAFGFETGMGLPETASDTLTHAGLYSMLMDVLTAPADSLPSARFRPRGVAPSILSASGVRGPEVRGSGSPGVRGLASGGPGFGGPEVRKSGVRSPGVRESGGPGVRKSGVGSRWK